MTTVHAPPVAPFDADHAATFLTAVYGGRGGLLQVCSSDTWVGSFFETGPTGIAAAVAYAQRLDTARPTGIYHRATTLTERPAQGRRGGASDTAETPTMWGDVDFGTAGHAGANLPPDQAAAEQLIAESGMPAPTILVHSGGGLYPLWRLDRPVGPAAAAELSERVQALLLAASQRHGWDYGTGVSDLARVLRLPGSTNRKLPGQDRPCRVISGTGVLVDPADIPELPAAVASIAPVGTRTLPPPARPYDPNRRTGPLDALAEHTTWADILEPADWTFVGHETVDGARCERWLRPGGATSEYSARAFEHNLVVHSDTAGLPSGPGQRLTKGKVFALLWHRGDTSAAARDILAAHDGRGTPAANALPRPVLDAAHSSYSAYDADRWGQLGVTLPKALPQASGDPRPHTPPQVAAMNAPRPSLAVVPPLPPPGLARFLLPEAVWTSSPTMAHIRAAGWARLVSPDVLLHGVLALIASLVHHGSRVDTGKGPSVLSYFVTAIGESGAGKSEALSAARSLLTSWSSMRFAITGDDAYIDAPLGSGEGLVEAFMGIRYVDKLDADGKPINDALGMPIQVAQRDQIRHNALFAADEGRAVLSAGERKGSTILAVLCEMWSGTTAGQTNAESARTRKLTAGTYVVGMLLGFQPATIDGLFADEAGGAPQRFVFTAAEYAPFGIDLDSEHVVAWPGELNPTIPLGPITVTLGPDQQREVRRAIRAKAAGLSTDGPLDGHRMLIRCRIAALLALLHSRTDVDANLWALADTITARSCALRDWLAEQGARKAAEQARARADATIDTTVRAQARVLASERVTRAAGQIARAVERAGGELSRGKAFNGIRSDLRDVRDSALDHAAAAGLVLVSEDGRTLTLPDGGPE